MGTPLENRGVQVEEALGRLYEEYPDTTISLSYSNRLELLITATLSAQCTDERIDKITTELFEKYDDVADYAAADQEGLADDISSITYYNNKAKYTRSACADIIEKHDGEVPDIMSALTDPAGIGRKTVNAVLQHDHDIVKDIVADTHVQRLSRRLGLTEGECPERIEEDLMPVIFERDWQQPTYLFVSHGRTAYGVRNPDYDACVLEDPYPSSKRDHDVDLASGEAW